MTRFALISCGRSCWETITGLQNSSVMACSQKCRWYHHQNQNLCVCCGDSYGIHFLATDRYIHSVDRLTIWHRWVSTSQYWRIFKVIEEECVCLCETGRECWSGEWASLLKYVCVCVCVASQRHQSVEVETWASGFQEEGLGPPALHTVCLMYEIHNGTSMSHTALACPGFMCT